jgi:hypothetical protein
MHRRCRECRASRAACYCARTRTTAKLTVQSNKRPSAQGLLCFEKLIFAKNMLKEHCVDQSKLFTEESGVTQSITSRRPDRRMLGSFEGRGHACDHPSYPFLGISAVTAGCCHFVRATVSHRAQFRVGEKECSGILS